MQFLYIVIFCSGILGVESYYNCSTDQYMHDRVKDCKYAFETGYNSSDCSAAKLLADNLDTCIQTALLGCDQYFVLLFEYDYSRDLIWDTAETDCTGTGHFDDPGGYCSEISIAEGEIIACINNYVPIYDTLDPNSPDYCSNFYGLLDTYKVCIDTVSAGCTHDGRNYLLTASAYYTDEQQYLEACTVPSDQSFNCDIDVNTTECWEAFEAENATITPLFPEDYCLELISAVDNYRTCVYNATMLLGCRNKFDEAMEAFTFAEDVSSICGGTACYGNQQLTTEISTTCISDLVNHKNTFDSNAKDETSCLLFRSQIADARNCTKEANAREGCLFNSLSVDSEITDADVSFSIACGFNSDTCSRKLVECTTIANDTEDAITDNAGCSVTYGHFNDLDWCIVQAATIGQCIQSELEDINQQRTYLFGNLPNCPNEGNCNTVPFLQIDAFCTDTLWYNVATLADNFAIDHPEFCIFFQEEITETHTCVKVNLEALNCDSTRANEITAYHDYLYYITCQNSYAQDLGSCSKPSDVLYGISSCAYGLKDKITDISDTMDLSNMYSKCSLIDDMLNSTNWCLFEALEEQNCEAQLTGLYDIVKEHAFPNSDVCVATTPPPPTITTEEATATAGQYTNTNSNNNSATTAGQDTITNINNNSAGSGISIPHAVVYLASALAYMTYTAFRI